MNNVIFLTSYQAVVMLLLDVLVINLASPVYRCPVEGVANCSFATNPIFSGVEFLCDDQSFLQELLGRGYYCFLIYINFLFILRY
jgi:hypothetical protein